MTSYLNGRQQTRQIMFLSRSGHSLLNKKVKGTEKKRKKLW